MSRIIKRIIDLLVAIAGITLLMPVYAIICILVYATMGMPAFYIQTRAGLNGKPFKIIKFRTMTNECNSDGELLPDEQRLTSIGKFLRMTSLDEILELFNVIKGDMSLIGPRPLLMRYLGRYTAFQERRHEVRPGITGWAQVNGRNSLSWEDKFLMDVWYIDNWSLRLDILILWRTIIILTKRQDISAEGHETMPEFMGYDAPVNRRPDCDCLGIVEAAMSQDNEEE